MVAFGNEINTVLKIAHVLVATFWLGGAFYFNVILGPILREATPQVRRELMGRLSEGSFRLGNVIGGLTVLTGAVLYYGQRGSFTMVTTSDRLIVFGFLAALAVLYLLNFSSKPTLKRLQKLMEDQDPGAPPPPMAMVLQKRMAITGQVIFILLILVATFMVMANTGVLS